MLMNRIVEYVFFFGFMGVVGYLVWEMVSPFVSALALSAIIVTICYPLYTRILRITPRKNPTIAALLTTLFVLLVVIIPVFLITSALVNEAVSVYKIVNSEQFVLEDSLFALESEVRNYFPGFELNVTEYLKQAASWLALNLGAIFAGTASTIFLFFIAMLGSFYLFRDGRAFTKVLVKISPLPDSQDEVIMKRLALAVRSVVTGTVLIALIQGVLTAFGLWIFGFERAILWGVIAAFGALIPSVGTTIVFVPAVVYLLFNGLYLQGIGLLVWGTLAVGLIDNLLGPYLMSRGNKLHPFLILLAVLGGLSVFGPIGFIVGPVLISLFIVLLELYSIHISDHKKKNEPKK
jgi:predicted PurR-regulated permease PerM